MIALPWFLVRQAERETGNRGTRPGTRQPISEHPTDHWSRRRTTSVVVTGIGVFFVYTGQEVAAGQWEASFGRGQRGLSPATAGIASFGYWAALTAARFGLALVRRPPKPHLIVRGGSVAAIVATTASWWQPDVGVTLSGFFLLGAGLAGVFPALIAFGRVAPSLGVTVGTGAPCIP